MPQGKILRVKQGYNPNSSSIGSMIFSMSAAVLPAAVVFGVVASAISAAMIQYAGKRQDGAAAVGPESPRTGGDADAS